MLFSLIANAGSEELATPLWLAIEIHPIRETNQLFALKKYSKENFLNYENIERNPLRFMNT